MLSLHGGTPYKTTPFGTGKRFSGREMEYLQEALEQNTLFYYFGKLVTRFTQRFAQMMDMPYCTATSSCTAAVHTALGVLGVGPGDEVITAPITDMGGVIGILYQGATPIFADVNPHTYNMTPAAIEAAVTPRTKVILVTHLAGNPCDMDGILAVARSRGLFVVEDCAQSYYSYYKGRLVGTFGDIGCFSTNDFKHISTGEGGMCVMRDRALYEKALRFADKGYNRLGKTTQALRAVESLCPNYRMSELQGAVGLAQLERLEWICAQRRALGDALTQKLQGIDGVSVHKVEEGNQSSYWFYLARVDNEKFPGGHARFAQALTAEGVPVEAGYIGRCVYAYELFHNGSLPHAVHYPKGLCPVAEQVLGDCVKIPLSEFYTPADIDDIAGAIRKIGALRDSLRG